MPDDNALRVAAFREVRRLADVNGDLTGRDLRAGFQFDGQRNPLINPQRGIFKPTQMGFLLSIRTVYPRPGARVWYDDLCLRWRREPAAIAGLTAHGALFCLERLAWDQRLRVVYRGEHAAAEHGVLHRLDGPAPMLSAVVDAAAELSWCAALADVVANCPRDRTAQRTATIVTSRGGIAPASEPLFSWVIAPAARS